MTERTFVIIKPDAVASGQVGAILQRYEEAGLRVEAMDLHTIDGDFADRHYAEHLGRDYYAPLRAFMRSSTVCVLRGSGSSDGNLTLRTLSYAFAMFVL